MIGFSFPAYSGNAVLINAFNLIYLSNCHLEIVGYHRIAQD